MQLHVHLHQRLLHVLDMRCRVLDDALTVAEQRPQPRDAIAWTEAAAEKAVFVKLLQPLCVVHVGLAARHVLRVPRVHQQHLEAASLKDLEYRDPVHARRLHRDGGHSDSLEPVGERMQIAGETLERPHRLRVAVRGYRHHVKRRADIQTRRVPMHRCERSPGLVALPSLRLCHCAPPKNRRGGMGELINFLNGIADRRHQSQVRSHPRAMFFYGLEAPKS